MGSSKRTRLGLVTSSYPIETLFSSACLRFFPISSSAQAYRPKVSISCSALNSAVILSPFVLILKAKIKDSLGVSP